ncbi:hypothetical protein [Marinobacter sp. CA1]|uniref:hypothetical protein n=1 Tax=Marinobacter sp. CA1 TaxID=2817656 RepID=UPI001D08F17D|nr:hypothetical protein J2887_12070 [Marinobacter sp. CA1]
MAMKQGLRYWGVRAGVVLGLVAVSPVTLAHNPVAQCEYVNDHTIRCQGGYSDGSLAPGVTMDVISYEEEILIPGELDADSRIEFEKPDGEFYILFDAGPGHVFEIDYTGIAP